MKATHNMKLINDIKDGYCYKLYFVAFYCEVWNTVLLRLNVGGRSFNFWQFLAGVYFKIQKKKLQFYISTSLISSSSSMLKTALSASSTLSCDINCSLPFWQGSPSLKQWIKQPSSELLVLRFKPHDLNELEKERGVYKIIWEKKGAFSRGRAFIQSNTVEELLFLQLKHLSFVLKTVHL